MKTNNRTRAALVALSLAVVGQLAAGCKTYNSLTPEQQVIRQQNMAITLGAMQQSLNAYNQNAHYQRQMELQEQAMRLQLYQSYRPRVMEPGSQFNPFYIRIAP